METGKSVAISGVQVRLVVFVRGDMEGSSVGLKLNALDCRWKIFISCALSILVKIPPHSDCYALHLLRYPQLQVKGEGNSDGAIYFLPPGVKLEKEGDPQDDAPQPNKDMANPVAPSPTAEEAATTWSCTACGHTNPSSRSRCSGTIGEGKCMAWRGGKRVAYFTKVRDVIERILEKQNEEETKAADAFLKLLPPEGVDMFKEQKEKKSEKSEQPPSPSRQTRHSNHFSWKDVERVHFDKTSSRVGSEYQVDVLPNAGSYTTTPSEKAQNGNAL